MSYRQINRFARRCMRQKQPKLLNKWSPCVCCKSSETMNVQSATQAAQVVLGQLKCFRCVSFRILLYKCRGCPLTAHYRELRFSHTGFKTYALLRCTLVPSRFLGHRSVCLDNYGDRKDICTLKMYTGPITISRPQKCMPWPEVVFCKAYVFKDIEFRKNRVVCLYPNSLLCAVCGQPLHLENSSASGVQAFVAFCSYTYLYRIIQSAW